MNSTCILFSSVLLLLIGISACSPNLNRGKTLFFAFLHGELIMEFNWFVFGSGFETFLWRNLYSFGNTDFITNMYHLFEVINVLLLHLRKVQF